MNPTVQSLIDALRTEMEQYGEMLARLDEQQASIVRFKGDEVIAAGASIDAQAAEMNKARTHRTDCAQAVARDLKCPDETPIQEMVVRLHKDLRPLVTELVRENNELIVRIQQRSRQNHLLLARSLESMQRMIDCIAPASPPTRYTPAGRAEKVFRPQIIYSAVG